MKDEWLNSEDRQSRIQYLWRYVPRAEACTACGNDKVDGVGRIINPCGDRLTDELCVIGDDLCVKDVMAAGLEMLGCSGPGLVQQIIRRRCIAHGQYCCGHHGIRVSGGAGTSVSTARFLLYFCLFISEGGLATAASRHVEAGIDNCARSRIAVVSFHGRNIRLSCIRGAVYNQHDARSVDQSSVALSSALFAASHLARIYILLLWPQLSPHRSPFLLSTEHAPIYLCRPRGPLPCLLGAP